MEENINLQLESILTRLERVEKALFKDHLTPTPTSKGVQFDVDERAFFQKHSKGMKGPQAFTLVVAWLTKGTPAVTITLDQARLTWNRVRGLMPGDLYAIYRTRARGSNWVRSVGKEEYSLTFQWTDVFEKTASKQSRVEHA